MKFIVKKAVPTYCSKEVLIRKYSAFPFLMETE